MDKQVHEVSREELEQWRQERLRVGQQRYGDRDLKRYGLLDVTEELLDCLNILERMENRIQVQGVEEKDARATRAAMQLVKNRVQQAIDEVQIVDEIVPAELKTDENGDDRIWWNDDT